MDILHLDDSVCADWDAFVDAHPDATFFHRSGWREVLRRAFGHRTYFLYASDQGRIVGVLPLAHVRSRLFGNALVSTPLCVYGGVVAISDQVRSELERVACELARELAVDWLELRNLNPSASQRPRKDLYVTFRRPIDGDPAQTLLSLPRKKRAVIRKALNGDLRCNPEPDLKTFYDIYAHSVRNLGTPVFPRALFTVLTDVFGESCDLLSVERDGRAISAVMSFYFRDEVLPYYAGGLPQARVHHAYDLMYWTLMRRAAERGVRRVDFGRSKRGTGAFDYKTHWGFEPTPLHYEYELIGAESVPDLNPLNPKYRLFIAAWKRLPLPISKAIGPWLSRSLG